MATTKGKSNSQSPPKGGNRVTTIPATGRVQVPGPPTASRKKGKGNNKQLSSPEQEAPCTRGVIECHAEDCQVPGHYHKRPAKTGDERRLQEKKDKKKGKKRRSQPLWQLCNIHLKHGRCGGKGTHGHCYCKPAEHWPAEMALDDPVPSPCEHDHVFQKYEFAGHDDYDFADDEAFEHEYHSDRKDEMKLADELGFSEDDEKYDPNGEDETFSEESLPCRKTQRRQQRELREHRQAETARRYLDTFNRKAAKIQHKDVIETLRLSSRSGSDEDPAVKIHCLVDRGSFTSDSEPGDHCQGNNKGGQQEVNTFGCTTSSRGEGEAVPVSGKSHLLEHGAERKGGEEDEEEPDIDEVFKLVPIFLLQESKSKKRFKLKRLVINALSYLPGLKRERSPIDEHINELIENSYYFQENQALRLTNSKLFGRSVTRKKTYMRLKPSKEMISELHNVFKHVVHHYVDLRVVSAVMNDENVEKCTFITRDGGVTALLRISVSRSVKEAYSKMPFLEHPVHGEISTNAELRTATVQHCMNLVLLREMRIQRALPASSGLDFQNRVPSP